MECYCNIHLADIGSDESFLLDDKNTSPLLRDFDETSIGKSQCVRCNGLLSERDEATNEWHNVNDDEDMKWRPRPVQNNTREVLDTFSTTVIVPNSGGRRSSNSTDSLDSPLLANDVYSDVNINDSQDCDALNFHCHLKSSHRRNDYAWKQLTAAALMCLLFMIAELVGGYLASSLAVMTDAAHLMSDFVGLLVSLFAIWMGRRPPTKRMMYGYYRAEVLGALFSITVIWIMTGVFIYLAILRVVHPDFKIKADTMMIVSGIGVLINILMGLILHGTCHTHSHSSTPAHLQSQTNNRKNINLKAAIIHVLGDLFQSVGVFIAAVIIKNYPNAKLADPICTFFFSIIVIFTTKGVFKDSINILMEGIPTHLNYNLVYTALKSIDGIRGVHSLHVWALTTDKFALGVHLVVDESFDKNDILKRATRLVRHKFEIDLTTIQIESYIEATLECQDCRQPLD